MRSIYDASVMYVHVRPAYELRRGFCTLVLYYYYYFIYQYRYKKIMKVRGEKCNEEGTLELIQWPSGLYPFANRGLTGSWTDQLNQLINQ